MCGISGYSSFKDYDPRLYIAMTNMALQMELRGKKSWGWTDGEEIVKSLGAISEGWNYSFSGDRYKCAALHTRHPTTGALVKENSHPFKIGGIVGMHNGVVYNHYDLQTKYKRNCSVDSEHIFHHINEGISLGDIKAYGAIVFWKEGILHIGRFNNGDMCIARTDVAWVFASTRSAVEQSLRFSGLQKNAVYMKLKENRLYKLVGDTIQFAEYLNFGEYLPSYGNWQTANSSNFAGLNTYVAPDVTKFRGVVPLLANPVVSLPEDSLKLASHIQSIGLMVRAAISKAKEVNDSLSTTSFNVCNNCDSVILGEFNVMDDTFLVCSKCSVEQTMQDRLINNRPLTLLPIDVVKLENLTIQEKDNDGYIACASCSNFFVKTDSIFITQFNDFICLDCFASGEGEVEIVDPEEVRLEEFDYEDKQIRVTMLEDDSIRVTHKNTGTLVEYPSGTLPSVFLQEV